MYITPEKIFASNKAGVEAFAFIAQTTFTSMERLAALNLNVARNMLTDAVAITKEMSAVKSPEELLAVQKSLAYPAFDKSVAYSRSVYEIVNETFGVLGKMVEDSAAQINSNVVSALDNAVKHAPAGSDVVVGAVKSAFTSANTAYDTMKKTAKQTVEMAESNVAAATEATLKSLKAA